MAEFKGNDMVKRLITAAIGIPIGVFILWLNNPHLLAGVCALLSVIAVYEILSAAKYLSHKAVSVTAIVFAFILPLLFCYDEVRGGAVVVAFLFLLVMLCAMLVNHKEVKFEEIGLVSLLTVCIPLSISTLAFFMFRYPDHGVFFIVYTLVVTWISDGGAYFVGTFLGKHKLCPEISPKKTWEGFIGGVVCTGIFAVLLGYGYELWDFIFTGAHNFSVNIPVLLITGLISSPLGVVGDLSASLLKRQCGVKDFGNILPGHGGIMDRFDSVIIVAPFVYLVFQIFYPITALV